MKIFIKYLKKTWQWIMDKAIAIILLLVAVAYIIGANSVHEQERKVKQEEFHCETSCFPQQNEYIYHGDVGSCWCYVDSKTMKKYNQE